MKFKNNAYYWDCFYNPNSYVKGYCMQKIYEKLLEILKEKKDVILAVIVKKTGSTPRKEGAAMLIDSENSYFTISGGVEEFKVINDARTLLKEKSCALKYYSIDNKKAGDLGMICGGENYIYFHYFKIEDLNNLTKAYDKSLKNSDICLLYDVKNFTYKIENKNNYSYNKLTDNRYFLHRINDKIRVFVFGAGHVSRATVPVLKHVDFETTVMDDREEFLDSKYFPEDCRLKKIDFRKLDITIGNADYVLIMTRGHKYDLEIAKYILENFSPAYMGCMGSRRKANHMIENLENLNLDLTNLYVPVGIEINSNTPEEIAISIVAQMIKLRNEVNNG